ncbi:MAG: hypothetical protein COV76_02110 [Candidatus Omnitrophica bacterium CG11_big_fil_rev_8_21_14_0_20_64_10]|nr:MAG: hypothetical protein COV76_02110 [Candidatus Omnitrophica bacterium CG11_big_fil_rev_8_21_14_0_20_64_10]
MSSPLDLAQALPPRVALSYRIAPLRWDGDLLEVGSSRSYRADEIEELRHLIGRPVRVVAMPEAELEAALRRQYGMGAELVERMLESPSAPVAAGSLNEAVQDLDAIGGEASVIRVINQMVSEAIRERATDIHLEPSEGGMAVRYSGSVCLDHL